MLQKQSAASINRTVTIIRSRPTIIPDLRTVGLQAFIARQPETYQSVLLAIHSPIGIERRDRIDTISTKFQPTRRP